MKRIVLMAMMLSIILSMSLFAGGTGEDGDGKREKMEGLSVGVILPTKDEPRWIQDETRFKDALMSAGYEVEILFSQGDPAREKANVESLLAKDVKVIIFCPHDGAAAGAAAEAAAAEGVSVISYDRLIRDTTAVDYYVTFDSVAVGEAFGQYLVDKASGTGNNLFLYAGAASDNNAFLFFQGAWNVLQPEIAKGTFEIQNSRLGNHSILTDTTKFPILRMERLAFSICKSLVSVA